MKTPLYQLIDAKKEEWDALYNSLKDNPTIKEAIDLIEFTVEKSLEEIKYQGKLKDLLNRFIGFIKNDTLSIKSKIQFICINEDLHNITEQYCKTWSTISNPVVEPAHQVVDNNHAK